MKKKTVFIDTNMVNGDGSYFIHEAVIRKGGYQIGDLVTAYQDYDAWTARIVNTAGTWGVELLSEAELISEDRYEGQQEGYAHGAFIQNLAVIRILQNLNAPDDLIGTVKRELNLL